MSHGDIGQQSIGEKLRFRIGYLRNKDLRKLALD